jgi:hypothetical protein
MLEPNRETAKQEIVANAIPSLSRSSKSLHELSAEQVKRNNALLILCDQLACST